MDANIRSTAAVDRRSGNGMTTRTSTCLAGREVRAERCTLQGKEHLLPVARATRAFHDYAPLRHHDDEESQRVYHHLPQGPSLD
ncbi:hypothetical protein [Variovorax rhizosphaerae]|uniref:Uncharacterized protein n=1 Tax=Variovorax rhizosphaerae TaxID=1836200 RepID=A0ABU8WYB4_9BURK